MVANEEVDCVVATVEVLTDPDGEKQQNCVTAQLVDVDASTPAQRAIKLLPSTQTPVCIVGFESGVHAPGATVVGTG